MDSIEVREIAARRYWRRADAELLVSAWQASGETMARFAARMGFAPRRLSRWTAAVAPPLGGQGREPRFIELRPAMPTRSAALEIAVGGAVVRVEQGFDAALLRRVVDALGAERC